MYKNKKIMSKEDSIITNLLLFFKEEYNFSVLYEIINKPKIKGSKKLSIRLIEYFVSNYSKKNNTIISIKKNNIIKKFIVWLEYNKELDSDGKEFFDPFCRGADDGKLIELEHPNGLNLYTTIAQMNYFRWAIKNNIITYVKQNIDEIYNSMTKKGISSETSSEISEPINHKLNIIKSTNKLAVNIHVKESNTSIII